MVALKRVINLSICILITCINIGCIKSTNLKFDISKMNITSYYSFSDYYSVLEIEGKIYINYQKSHTTQEDYKEKGIYRFENGSLTLIYKGEVSDFRSYEHWLYFIDISSNLCRIDINNQNLDIILKKISSYIICPAGIFWVEKVNKGDYNIQQIKHANLEGLEVEVIYEAGNEGTGLISDIRIYHHSLYFNQIVPESNYLTTVEYRINMETGVIEKPAEMQKWQLDSKNTKSIMDSNGTAVNMYMYDVVGYMFSVDNNWLYFKPINIWHDPDTKLMQMRSDDSNSFYKIRENGTERTRISIDILIDKYILYILNEWIYYAEKQDKGLIVYRIKENGKEKQPVIMTPCKVENIFGSYLYYSLEFDENRKPMLENYFRVNLETLGKPERLY